MQMNSNTFLVYLAYFDYFRLFIYYIIIYIRLYLENRKVVTFTAMGFLVLFEVQGNVSVLHRWYLTVHQDSGVVDGDWTEGGGVREHLA